MDGTDDLSLIEATLRGDVEAFGGLVERYQGPLFSVSHRITGNREDALEATQTAFLKAYDQLRAFDPSRRFFSWICRIAVNESIDIVHHRRRFLDNGGAETLDLRAPDDPLQAYSASEASERVRRALLQLQVEHRVVVVLRHLEELSYSEMAELIGIPEKTVKSRLFSARRALRELLTGSGDLNPPLTPRRART